MPFQGLPDFSHPIQGEGFQIFRPYEKAGNYLLTPDHLEIAEGTDGQPQFLIEFLRGENPDLPPVPYALLDMRIKLRYPMEAALVQLRASEPEASLEPVFFSGGFLRIGPAENTTDFPSDLGVPVPLAWNGLTTGRYVLRLSQNSALKLKGALESGIMTLLASSSIEVTGVAPRLPVRVGFDPPRLLNALNAARSESGLASREKIVQFFRQARTSLPLDITGDIPDKGEFAETMTDWVRNRFAALAAFREDDPESLWLLKSSAEIGTGRFEWDLSQPIQTCRPLALGFDPLEAARQLVNVKGIGTFTRYTVLPPIQTGTFPVSISANLPSCRPGILSIGVTIKVPPRLPFRPQAVIESTEFTPPDDRARLNLRLSPGEPLQYTYSTFVVRQDSSGISEMDGDITGHEGDSLDLKLCDFPVNFIPVTASPQLLAIATIEGTCRWTLAKAQIEQRFKLDGGHTTIGLSVPTNAEEPTIEFKACSLSDDASVTLGPVAARGVELGLNSFREYGPHTVHIECTFDAHTPLLAIDLLPADRSETEENITVIALAPAQPSKSWSYFSQSPFHAGYRYRFHARTDDEPTAWSAWSDIHSPFGTLRLTPGA